MYNLNTIPTYLVNLNHPALLRRNHVCRNINHDVHIYNNNNNNDFLCANILEDQAQWREMLIYTHGGIVATWNR